MGDGTTTRLQKDLAALNQKHDSLEAKIDAKYQQLDAKIDSSVGRLQTTVDQLAMDMRRFLELFAADATAEKDKIPTVMMHLEGQALQWHLRYMRTMEHTGELAWFTYLFAMRERFGCNDYMKPFAQLVALKQTGYVDEFFNASETLLNLCNCSEEQALSIFLTILKPEISRQVQVNHPHTLSQAVNYARHIEFLLNTANNQYPSTTFLPISTTPVTHVPYKPPKKSPPVLSIPNTTPMITYPKTFPSKSESPTSPRIPSREERDTRRKQGLCMWCGIKFSPGHRCGVKAQLYQLLYEENAEPSADTDESIDSVDLVDETASPTKEGDLNPLITLYALLGATGPQTMRVAGKIKNQWAVSTSRPHFQGGIYAQ
ncbi:Retrotransposon gag protein [Corchorus olitorius]|uniref:Retrotransposon gag protein n=1 Tax=Corchorus olitorius TaxID=93759 RepID=A0A1R3INB0_9ROSI|nr:Retrotransposon gag protein [Corchorus olitorius]